MSGVSKKTPLPHWQAVMDKAGWTNASDMAKAARLSQGTAHFVIYGEVTPSNDTILKIAKAAGLPPEDIASDIFKYALHNHATTSSIAR